MQLLRDVEGGRRRAAPVAATGASPVADDRPLSRSARPLAALACTLAAASAGVLVTPAASGSTRAALRVRDLSPLTVHGKHFRRREWVRVTVSAPVKAHRRVRTSRTGTFTVRFGDVATDHCSGIAIRARGANADHATFRHPPLPECAPSGST